MVNARINGIPVQVAEGTTILDAAEKANIRIPKLCYNDDLPPWAACGICVVKVEKNPKMLRSCCTPLEEGMNVITHDPEIVQVRKTVIELILSTHPDDCLQCPRNQSCELQTLAQEFGIRNQPFEKRLRDLPIDTSTGTLILNPDKCIRCGRCVAVCQQMQNVWAIEFLGRGESTRIAPAADVKLVDGPCIKCGQCSAHCPVGAIYENDQTKEVWDALMKTGTDDMTCVVQIAPAVRVALGEEFGLEPGTVITDTNFSADLTIMEEGTEFVKRFTDLAAGRNKDLMPLITSCCPAWVDYMEKYYADMIPNFSTAKSPQQMMGAMIKTFWAEKAKVNPKKIFSVSIMPCTAKKWENSRNKDMWSSGEKDVDITLTTRELARMIKQAGIDLVNLPDEEADSPMGPYTGAGTIFGATGGVMEAALRSAYYLVTKEDLKDVNFTGVRGISGIKEARVHIKGIEVRVAVAHQMGNIASVLEEVRKAKAEGKDVPWHFIEAYGATDIVRQKRMAGIYSDDEQSTYRCSHHNPHIATVYKEFLGEPNGHKAHEILHTKYVKKELYNI